MRILPPCDSSSIASASPLSRPAAWGPARFHSPSFVHQCLKAATCEGATSGLAARTHWGLHLPNLEPSTARHSFPCCPIHGVPRSSSPTSYDPKRILHRSVHPNALDSYRDSVPASSSKAASTWNAASSVTG